MNWEDCLLMEEFSQSLLRTQGPEAWKAVFILGEPTGVRLERATMTLVCCDVVEAGWSLGHVARIAAIYGGDCARGRSCDFVLAFDRPEQALRAALSLQQAATAPRARSALVTGVVGQAVFRIEGREQRMTLEVDAAERAFASAPVGTVGLCARTYALVQDRLVREAGDALVVIEVEDDTVTAASVTVPPRFASVPSTFAGLGLT